MLHCSITERAIDKGGEQKLIVEAASKYQYDTAVSLSWITIPVLLKNFLGASASAVTRDIVRRLGAVFLKTV